MDYSLNKSIEFIKKNRNRSNKAELANFDHCVLILSKELWKKEEYYENKKYFKRFGECDFETFLIGAFHVDRYWFKVMNNIISLPEGREVFLDRGFKDCVSYLNFPEERRESILDHASKSEVYMTLTQAKNELFPEKKTAKKKDKTPKSINEKKKDKKIKELEDNVKKKGIRIKQLEAKIKELEEVIVGLKKAMALEYLFLNNEQKQNEER